MTPFYLSMLVAYIPLFIKEKRGLSADDVTELVAILNDFDITDRMLGTLNDHPECQEILRILPFLDPDKISARMLDDLCEDKQNQEAALEILQRNSLIIDFLSDDLSCIRLHRLVSEAMLRRLKTNMPCYKDAKKKLMKKFEKMSQLVEKETALEKLVEKKTQLLNHMTRVYQLISADDSDEINFIDSLILFHESTNFLAASTERINLQQEKIEKLKRYYNQEENDQIADNYVKLCLYKSALDEFNIYGPSDLTDLINALGMLRRTYANSKKNESYANQYSATLPAPFQKLRR